MSHVSQLALLTPLVDGGISKALPRFNVPAPFTTSSRLC